jgi:type II secretory pathway predicted ATPase ExeA
MEKKLLALCGLKFNPFAPGLPTSALHCPPAIEDFCWRVEQLVSDGGFALVTGDPGTGKSAALRILAERLSLIRDVTIGLVSRPQASVADFYRELGHLYGVALAPHNRWAGAKALRERWLAHIEASLARPVLLIDEAQEMSTAILSELRLLSSTDLDSKVLLTIVLSGDMRLAARLQTPELLPVTSRIRTRLRTEAVQPPQLREHLLHLLKQAGNPKVMTPGLVATLCEHAAGNLRAMTSMANEMLTLAMHDEIEQLDEPLYLRTFPLEPQTKKRRSA